MEDERGVFTNYSLYSASPAGGYRKYLKLFKSDLERKIEAFDSVDNYTCK